MLEWEENLRKHIRTMPITQYKALIEAMQLKFGKFCTNQTSAFKINKTEFVVLNNVYETYMRKQESTNSFKVFGLTYNSFRNLMFDFIEYETYENFNDIIPVLK